MTRALNAAESEVFGCNPMTWDAGRLKDVLRQVTTTSRRSATQYIGLEHVTSWTGRVSPISLEMAGYDSAQQIPCGALCFSKLRPYLAKAFVAAGNYFATGELLVTRALPSSDQSYLLYWLLSHRFINATNDATVGTKMPRVDWSIFSAMPVPLPKLHEQRRIANWLDVRTGRIDRRIELLGKKRELLLELRRNLVAEVISSGLMGQDKETTGVPDLSHVPMGWKTSQVKRLLRFTTSGSRGWAEYYADEGDLFLRIGNLTRETIDLDLSDVQYVALPAKAAEGKRTQIREGDILVSITADLGSIAVAPKLDRPAYVNQHIALCRPKDIVHPRWLGYAMLSSQSKKQMMNSGYGGTKIQLSLDDVRNVWVAVPSFDEQREIVAYLDSRLNKIARQISLIDRLGALLNEQRKALIHEAVTGQINLKNYEPLARAV